MKNTDVRPPVLILVLAISIIVFAISGCSRGTVSNANANINTNINTNTSVVNTNVNAAPPSTLAAREPDTYSATLMFSAETEGGEKTVGIPTLSADVARSGQDRRVSFKLPDGSDLIYLDHAGTHYAILPARRQYAELTPAATGFQLHKLMTPGQLVAYLDRLQGIQPAGDETVNGRMASKYRYSRTSQTQTSAGEVRTESFVYVDKETGLPLRAELFTEASGNVQGVRGATIVAEMRNITTNVDRTLFEVPTTYNKVSEQQVRAQVDAITNTIAAVLRTLLSNMNTAPPPSPSPTATPATGAPVPPQ
ncbi:MAG TPA: hypothetical protein VFO99_15235 [Pyrinomonadaceae bacterium]|nr:hypothetical protein [Pyrinomonadaceae bacterium]